MPHGEATHPVTATAGDEEEKTQRPRGLLFLRHELRTAVPATRPYA
jgi:hypothetical protein